MKKENQRNRVNPNLPSGRQPFPQVATAESIQRDRLIASGHHKFNKSTLGENPMSNNKTENNNATSTSTSNETVIVNPTKVAENTGQSIDVGAELQKDESAVEVHEANPDKAVTAEAIAEVTETVKTIREGVAEFQEELAEMVKRPTVTVDSLSLFEQLLQPVGFNYIENVIVFTLPITAEAEDYFTAKGIEQRLSEVPQLFVNEETESYEVSEDSIVNIFNPFSKKENGWLVNTFPALVEFVNDIAEQKLPILAGSDNMALAANNIALTMSSMIEGIPNSIAFDDADAISGYIVNNDLESDVSDDDTSADESADDIEGEFELPVVTDGLDYVFNVLSYANQVEDDSTTYNIVNNMQIELPCFYSKSKKNAYLLKIKSYFEKRVVDSNVPVYLNVTFNTHDIISNLEFRDCVDALTEEGFECITRTQALEALADGYSVLPEDLDVQFVTNLDSLFGDADILLTVKLTPDAVEDTGEEEVEASEED